MVRLLPPFQQQLYSQSSSYPKSNNPPISNFNLGNFPLQLNISLLDIDNFKCGILADGIIFDNRNVKILFFEFADDRTPVFVSVPRARGIYVILRTGSGTPRGTRALRS